MIAFTGGNEMTAAAGILVIDAGNSGALDGPAYFNRPGPRVVRGAEVLVQVFHEVCAGAPVERGAAHRA
ncbi:hypothetical protein [Streptosporangium minutum]|nr:hypothetical protein [Streptosporangium minutum]